MNGTKELDFREKHAEDLRRIKRLRLIDDDFMTKVFEDRTCAELLLRIILNRNDLKVIKVHSQYGLKNLQGRSARLDILAIDADNKVYNIEIQRSDKGAEAKRARYNSALIDANITEPGEEYAALNESYVIFITEKDILKQNLPIYHIDRVVRETGELFGDGEHIIYVNSQIQDETELGKLMRDFYCTDADEMHNQPLADRVRYYKEDQEGAMSMCRELEQMRAEAAAEAAAKAAAEKSKSITHHLNEIGMSIEQIAGIVDVPIETIKEWLAEVE